MVLTAAAFMKIEVDLAGSGGEVTGRHSPGTFLKGQQPTDAIQQYVSRLLHMIVDAIHAGLGVGFASPFDRSKSHLQTHFPQIPKIRSPLDDNLNPSQKRNDSFTSLRYSPSVVLTVHQRQHPSRYGRLSLNRTDSAHQRQVDNEI